MEKFSRLESIAVPVASSNVDTDQLVPARFLKKLRQNGFGQYLFYDLRHSADDSENPEFILNRPEFSAAKIMVAGQNFGCGSSRESAVWALFDYGFRTVIAPSFGDIFFNNCLKNGLLPVALPADAVARLLSDLQKHPGQIVTVDLPSQTVTLPDQSTHHFEVEPFAKECLLGGLDELDYTLSRMEEIMKFEAAHNLP